MDLIKREYRKQWRILTLYPDVLSFTSVTKRPQLWRVAVVAGLGCDRKVYEEIFSGAAPRLQTQNTDSLVS